MKKRRSPWVVTRDGARISHADRLRSWLNRARWALTAHGRSNVLMACVVLFGTLAAVAFPGSQRSPADPHLTVIRAGAPTAQAESFDGSRVVIIDGDTFALGMERFRILNIDTPETHSPRCEKELARGLKAKERLAELLRAGRIEVERDGQDRYGRTLARVFAGRRDVGEVLIRKASPYLGGRGQRRARSACARGAAESSRLEGRQGQSSGSKPTLALFGDNDGGTDRASAIASQLCKVTQSLSSYLKDSFSFTR
jgi:endonuclease YncB( thermonuclease family)